MSKQRGESVRDDRRGRPDSRNRERERGASTPGRIAAVLALVVALGVAVALLFGGDDGHKYTLLFKTGGQIVPGNEVLVAGQRVGMVDSIDLTDDNQAAIKVTMQEPLREGTTAIIRSTSLSGVANRYIALTPGPNNEPDIPDGDTISGTDTTAPVDIDQLFNVFGPKERAALQKFIRGNADAYAGKAKLANRAYKFINPSLSTSEKVFSEVSGDSVALERLLVHAVLRLGAVGVHCAARSALLDALSHRVDVVALANRLSVQPRRQALHVRNLGARNLYRDFLNAWPVVVVVVAATTATAAAAHSRSFAATATRWHPVAVHPTTLAARATAVRNCRVCAHIIVCGLVGQFVRYRCCCRCSSSGRGRIVLVHSRRRLIGQKVPLVARARQCPCIVVVVVVVVFVIVTVWAARSGVSGRFVERAHAL